MKQHSQPVPLLSDLPLEQLAAVVGKHLEYCSRHDDLTAPQMSISKLHMETEEFECNGCGHKQRFNTSHIDTTSLDRYICDFLTQGVRFNKKHKACVVPQ